MGHLVGVISGKSTSLPSSAKREVGFQILLRRWHIRMTFCSRLSATSKSTPHLRQTKRFKEPRGGQDTFLALLFMITEVEQMDWRQVVTLVRLMKYPGTSLRSD